MISSSKMSRRQILDLWEGRFQKLLRLEGEAYAAYRLLLKKYSHLLAGTRLRQMIREIMLCESEHIRIAQKLLDIVRKKKQDEK